MSGVTVAAAILAAGGSSRLGEPKQLVSYQGRPLLRHVLDQVTATACPWVGVVLGAHAALIAGHLGAVHATMLRNDHWREGVSTSLREAAQWADRLPCDGLLVILGDQVRISTEHLGCLVQLFEGSRCLVASRYGEVVGAPAIFPRAAFGAIARLQGDRGARSLIKRTRPRLEVPWEGGQDDLDTPADKARLADPRPFTASSVENLADSTQ